MNKYGYLALIPMLFLLISCERPLGYGVFLWPEDQTEIESGAILRIMSESQVYKQYSYYPLDEKQNTLSSATWRIALYPSKSVAVQASIEYEPYRYLMGKSKRKALPVRETANRTSRIVYRMREGEVSKIISRGEQSDEAGFVDYWYKILTTDGIEGWLFGYYLDVYSVLDDEVVAESTDVDVNINQLLHNVWRPAYFQDMLENKQIILEQFDERLGLFPDQQNKKFTLVTTQHSTSFTYTELKKIREDLYTTLGSNVQIFFANSHTISLTYQFEDEEHSIALAIIDESIDTIIAREKKRRAIVYQELFDRGPILVSDTYGTLQLFEDQRFVWNNHSTFSNNALPSSFSGSGTFAFDIFLSPEMPAQNQYDGAFSLHVSDANARIHFMYILTAQGIRLLYLPSSLIQQNLVTQIPISPVILFFTFSDN